MGSCCSIHSSQRMADNQEVVNSIPPEISINRKDFNKENINNNDINNQNIDAQNNIKKINSMNSQNSKSFVESLPEVPSARKNTDRELMPMNRQHGESIIDYFKSIILYPNKYIKEAKVYGVEEILKEINKKIDNNKNKNKNKNLFQKNRFYNCLLESFINRTPGMD